MNDNEQVQIVSPNTIESIARAEIDTQIATAKRYPRDIATVKREMISFATLDQETAEACFYTLPRGGKSIQGPSVRLAELAVHCMGNIRVQTRILETVTDGNAPHVTVQAVCADLEKNVAVSIEKRRRIVSKKDFKTGNRKPIDEDDINLATNACAAIAFRDAAFKVVPGALVRSAWEQARKVAIGDAKTLTQRVADAFDKFSKMGVNEERILTMLGKSKRDSVDLNDLEMLFGLFTAIKDGQATIEDCFPTKAKEVATPKPLFVAKPPTMHDNAPAPTATPDHGTGPADDTPAAPVPQEPALQCIGAVQEVVKGTGKNKAQWLCQVADDWYVCTAEQAAEAKKCKAASKNVQIDYTLKDGERIAGTVVEEDNLPMD